MGISAAPLPTSTPSNDTQQLGALLGWLRRLLAWQVELTRQTYGALAADEYRGLYIPDAEADILGDAPPELSPELAGERAALAAEREALDDAAAAAGAPVPSLHRVGALFGLDAFERDVLLLALAPELDLRFERLYAYVQDDVTKKRPSVDLALRLLCATPAERLARRSAFAPDAPLVRHRLVHLFEDGQRHPPLLARFFKLDDRVVAELVGDGAGAPADEADGVDPAIAPFASLGVPRRPLDTLVLDPELAGRLRDTVLARGDGLVLALQGAYGSGRRAVAEALCAAAGVPLLAVRLDAMVRSDADGAAPPGGAGGGGGGARGGPPPPARRRPAGPRSAAPRSAAPRSRRSRRSSGCCARRCCAARRCSGRAPTACSPSAGRPTTRPAPGARRC